VSSVGGRDPQRQDFWKRKQKSGFLPHCRCRMQMTGLKNGHTSIEVDGFQVECIDPFQTMVFESIHFFVKVR